MSTIKTELEKSFSNLFINELRFYLDCLSDGNFHHKKCVNCGGDCETCARNNSVWFGYSSCYESCDSEQIQIEAKKLLELIKKIEL